MPSARAGSWKDSIGRAAGSLRQVGGRNAEPAHSDFAVVASSPLNDVRAGLTPCVGLCRPESRFPLGFAVALLC